MISINHEQAAYTLKSISKIDARLAYCKNYKTGKKSIFKLILSFFEETKELRELYMKDTIYIHLY